MGYSLPTRRTHDDSHASPALQALLFRCFATQFLKAFNDNLYKDDDAALVVYEVYNDPETVTLFTESRRRCFILPFRPPSRGCSGQLADNALQGAASPDCASARSCAWARSVSTWRGAGGACNSCCRSAFKRSTAAFDRPCCCSCVFSAAAQSDLPCADQVAILASSHLEKGGGACRDRPWSRREPMSRSCSKDLSGPIGRSDAPNGRRAAFVLTEDRRFTVSRSPRRPGAGADRGDRLEPRVLTISSRSMEDRAGGSGTDDRDQLLSGASGAVAVFMPVPAARPRNTLAASAEVG